MNYIFETIQKYHMIEPGTKVVAGISGGADSVCLLYALSEYQKQVPFEILAVHVEHGIRGEASLGDAVFTEKLCRSMGIFCRTVAVSVQAIAKEQGLSVEEAGRRERYRIFEEIRKESGADRIAVAHNQNDQAETMLWNLARGSGLKGLGGIRPVRGNIIRPLLFTERKRIEQILTDAGLSWRTDGTNMEQEYTRNRIRLSLIPQMEQELNAQAGLHIAQAAEKLQQVQDYLERVTERIARVCIVKKEDSVELELETFLAQDKLIQAELLKKALVMCKEGYGLKDMGNVHLQMLSDLASMDCGKECHLPGIRAVREQGIIRFLDYAKKGREKCGKLSQIYKDVVEKGQDVCQAEQKLDAREGYILTIPGRQQIGNLLIHTSLIENNSSLMEEIQKEKKYTKWLSYDTIKNDVRLRKREAGDYLVVNESGGCKKLKDYFINCKIPRDKRDDIWLLADGSHVVWVVGYRISSAVRVTQGTKKILKVQIEEVLS